MKDPRNTIKGLTLLAALIAPLSATAQSAQLEPPAQLVACYAAADDLQRGWIAVRTEAVVAAREIEKLKKQIEELKLKSEKRAPASAPARQG